MRGLDQDVKFRDAAPEDAAALSAIGRETFIETFSSNYAAGDLTAFLDRNFSPDIQAKEIADPETDIRVAEAKRALIAYAKIAPLKLPIDAGGRRALELHRIYVHSDRQGVGVGRILLTWTINRARERGAEDLYLGVWSENSRAIAVYESRGFDIVGRYGFPVGGQTDEELIMRKSLT
ncbi:MAG: GNAT family N-acetyltransferase [Pseudomonadota bacterium]